MCIWLKRTHVPRCPFNGHLGTWVSFNQINFMQVSYNIWNLYEIYSYLFIYLHLFHMKFAWNLWVVCCPWNGSEFCIRTSDQMPYLTYIQIMHSIFFSLKFVYFQFNCLIFLYIFLCPLNFLYTVKRRYHESLKKQPWNSFAFCNACKPIHQNF